MQQQSGSQYGLPPLEMGPGYSPAPQMIGIHQAAGAKAEAASPISSRPGPPGEAIFGELGGPARIFAEEESVMITGAGEDGERGGGGGGNRWPRQETLALLKFRSDMDSAFRDATLKGPLWEDVSRKLGELGYCRSAKKCKEKFENVHKYYKRTKEGRAGRQDGKSYRFFTQLEALQGAAAAGLPTAAAAPSLSSSPNTSSLPAPTPKASNAFSASSSESSDGEETDDAGLQQTDGGRKRKRQGEKAAAALFKDLMKQLMERQEAMQRRFLEAIEKREQDRMAREEAWKRQEMARLNREYELMAQERTMAATRDAAVISFLQKFAGPTSPPAIPAAPPPDQSPPQPQPSETGQEIVVRHEATDPISAVARPTSRWPKAEVLALIKLRSGLDGRYMEAGPKGPLWEEISMGMKRLGYTRSTKRCKEKWENINKYFKKVKEGNKKRPEDAKTCPYFHELDALYRRKQQQQQQQDPLPISIANGIPQPFFGANGKKPEDIVKDLMEHGNQEDDDDDIHDGDDDEDEDEDYDDDDDDENGKLKYEIQFQRQPPSMGGGGSAASGASQPPVPPSSNAGSFLAMVQ